MVVELPVQGRGRGSGDTGDESPKGDSMAVTLCGVFGADL